MNQNIQRAEETYRNVIQCFHLADEGRYLENAPRNPADNPVAYLWPVSALFSAVNALAKLPEIGPRYHADVIRVKEELGQYLDERWLAYDSYVRSLGGGQKFYDDNQWLGLDFVESFESMHRQEDLTSAICMFEFALEGWSSEHGGGIYWREHDEETKNTCSNGPAAVLALRLYDVTRKPEYLEWAHKILNWVRCLKDPESGVYWDNVNKDGAIDKRTYTYNTGTILHANALLYGFTQDSKYLYEARQLAISSVKHFTQSLEGLSVPVFPQTPWFNAVLFRGYRALYTVDPLKDTTYLDLVNRNADLAWDQARDANGLFSSDWTGRAGLGDRYRPLLEQAAMVELFAICGRQDIK